MRITTTILSTVALTIAASIMLALAGCNDTSSTPSPKPANVTAAGNKTPASGAAVQGWLSWRGPNQNGTSDETGLPDTVALENGNLLWTFDMFGRGTPVIAGNRVYSWGYGGEGPNLRERLVCLEADTGKVIWEHKFNDFISDIIYDRYSIGSPTVDGDTGNVYLLTTTGLLNCFTADGKLLWQHSMMEQFGRLTFPNGRTGCVVIDGDLLITRGITSNWGAQGPPADRFYAFDKLTGEPVWASTPGVGPPFLKDSSFTTPVLAWQGGKRVFYVGLGCGNVACVNARTGDPLWRYQFSIGGINSSVLLYKDTVIAVHGVENLDATHQGRMAALKVGAEPKAGEKGPVVLDKSAEVWRNDAVNMFTSSPVLVGNRVFQVDQTGVLFDIDADTGKTLWTMKLGTDQIHASPLWADGKLYVPMNEGFFYVLKPSDSGADELAKVKLEGACLGSPAAWNGKVYVHSTKKLYCFGTKGDNPGVPKPKAAPPAPAPGKAVELQVIPSEVLLRPGQKATFRVRSLDDNGLTVGDVSSVTWAHFIPPTAKVKASMDAEFNAAGELVAGPDAKQSAGAFKATAGDLSGTIRGRILAKLPYTEDFERFALTDKGGEDPNTAFAYPPLSWIGARFKWEVHEKDGSKVLAKTLNRLIFQRSTTFIGSDDLKNYTIQADVMTEGNRRLKSEIGLIDQRYIVVLKGNAQEIEINSNHERIKLSQPFKFDPNVWYTLKMRVDVNADGSGVVRGKAWKKADPEPADWTIQFNHEHAHTHGAPGFFAFSPNSKFRVYLDNLTVTPN